MEGDVVLVIVVVTALVVRLHERLPRHRQRRRDVDLHRARCRRGSPSACAAILNFVGAFISIAVAATIAEDSSTRARSRRR